jgi:PAS domain S-box-containing protein
LRSSIHTVAGSESRQPSQTSLANALRQLGEVLEALRMSQEEQHAANDHLAAVRAAITSERCHYQQLLELAPGAFVVTTAQATIVHANKSTAALFGVEPKDLVGKPLSIFVPLRERRDFRTRLAQLMPGETRGDWPVILQPRHGAAFHSRLTVAVISGKGAPELLWMISAVSERGAEPSLSGLASRLLQTQDEERRLLSRDLHESTAQKLAGVVMKLAVVRQSQAGSDDFAQKTLAETIELAEECLREIRAFTYRLHPPLLDEIGLAFAVRWYVDGFTHSSGIHIDVDIAPNLTRLPQEIETTVFRVLQECLANVERHAHSATAQVELLQQHGAVMLRVSDQGCGMPAQLPNAGEPPQGCGGIGIAGMRERLRQIGGQLAITSGRTGTTVTAILPLHLSVA